MYLSSIFIRNFRGIKELNVNFDKKLNVIIGANGHLKTALIDAIRLFYSWGNPNRDIEITKEDFRVEISESSGGSVKDKIEIAYKFEGLSEAQEAAYYQYLVCGEKGMYARIGLTFQLTAKGRIVSSYTTGKPENGLRADWDTFQYFVSYYLGALRDSTRDLLSYRNNLLGSVIKRKIDKAGSENDVRQIIKNANQKLLEREEVISTKNGINDNLENINKQTLDKVSLHIEQSRVEYIINVIKPYLPFSENTEEGFMLTQNSLGFNNLIYIATVLSDIKECHEDDQISTYALFIEEPEAHLHPQLQVNLYDFLRTADDNVNSQTFITTHSPTLTSKIPLENLILLEKNCHAIKIGNCFNNRESEGIIRDANSKKRLRKTEVESYKKMIMRYLDVTRSQLFFSSGCIFIEGISECQLLEVFSKILNKSLLDNQIEIVDTGGIAFYQFLMLFNSSDETKRLSIKASIITDEDQFTESKDSKYNLDELVKEDYKILEELRNGINKSKRDSHIDNLKAMCNNQENIFIASGVKTLEYQICLANIATTAAEIKSSSLFEYVKELNPNGIKKIETYLSSIGSESLNDEQRQNTAILLWKCLPSKAGFAQGLSTFLMDKIDNHQEIHFTVPKYIENAINHLIS